MQELMNQASNKINSVLESMENLPAPLYQAKVGFLMTIEGKPMHVYVSQTSGNREFDALLVKTIEGA